MEEVSELQTPSSIPQIELPQQLITSEILVRLPIKSLIRFKSVSKEWKSIISSPNFAKIHLHFQRSSPNYSPKLLFDLKYKGTSRFFVFDYSTYEKGFNHLHAIKPFREEPSNRAAYHVWGSSDGLLLLGTVWSDFCCYVLNPTTRVSRMIPCPSAFGYHKKWKVWGFGYVSSIDDYKIVCFSLQSEFGGGCKYNADVFTLCLKAGTWKKAGCDGVYLDWGEKPGVLVNEISYRILRNTYYEPCIVGFDLASEEFMELKPPEGMKRGDKGQLLSVIDGCLCFCSFEYCGRVDISMLKEDAGGSTSWVKFYGFYHGCLWGFNCVNVSGVWSGKYIMSTSRESTVFIDMNQDPPLATKILISNRKQTPKRVEYYVESLMSPFGVVEGHTEDDGVDSCDLSG